MNEENKLKKQKKKFMEEKNYLKFADACNTLGGFYQNAGQYQKALAEYQLEAKTYKDLNKTMDNAKAHRMIGEVYVLLEKIPEALKHEEIYLKTAKQEENLVEQQRAYMTIGRIYLIEAQINSDVEELKNQSLKYSEKSFIKSLLICKKLKGMPNVTSIELMDMQARLYLNLGLTKENTGQLTEAVNYMERAIAICQSNNFSDLLHKCYMDMAGMYNLKHRDTTLALKYFNLALDVAERLNNRVQKICETLLAKSEILIKLGDWQSVKQVLHKSYKLKSPEQLDREQTEKWLKLVAALCYTEDALITADPVDYATKKKLYEKMGDGSCKLLNFSKAIDYYLRMLENAELNGEKGKELISTYVSLYETYKDNAEYDISLMYLQKLLDIERDNPKEVFSTLINIYEVYELQSALFYDREKVLLDARLEAQKIGNQSLEKLTIYKLMELYKKENMSFLLDNLKKEIEISGIDLSPENGDVISSDDDNDDSTENVPDIGDDICLDNLSDSSMEESSSGVNAISTSARKKRSTFKVKKKNLKGETPLHEACISGNIALVRRLLDQDHPTNVRDYAGWLPLHEAANHGFTEIVEMLLKKGGSSQINDKGGTSCEGISPLFDACSNGHLDVVQILLDYGANSTLLTDAGETPLDGIDRWRSTVSLDDEEEQLFDKIRSRLSNNLKSAGINAPSQSTNSSRLSLMSSPPNSDHSESFSGLSRKSPRTQHKSRPLSLPKHDSSTNCIHESSRNGAALEYKQAIASIRRKGQSTADNLLLEKVPKRSALIAENEIVDNWLDNDVGPSKKKTKLLSEIPFEKGESSRSRKSWDSSSSNTPVGSAISRRFDQILYNSDDESRDAFEIIMSNNENNVNLRNRSPSVISSTSSKSGKLSLKSSKSSSTKHQSSLLDSGFSRMRCKSPPIIENYQSAYIDQSPEPSQPKRSTMSPKADMINVKCEDQLYIIVVETHRADELNMGWLAEQVAERHYKTVGIRPSLQLMTLEGGQFDEETKVSIPLFAKLTLVSKILEWKVPPINERYLECCKQSKKEPEEFLKKIFETTQATDILNLPRYSLQDRHAPIIFKTLKLHSSLISINFANNQISNESFKQFFKILPTLTGLRVLNLQTNFIQSQVLRLFADTLSNNFDCLRNLSELSLSFNPFGSAGIEPLTKIINILRELKKLSISGCNIIDLKEYEWELSRLSEFNVAMNKQLKMYSTKKILNSLDATVLNTFDFSYSITYFDFGDDLSRFLVKGAGKLKEISLIGCQLTDDDLEHILNALDQYESVEVLRLSENSFTSIGFKLFFNRKVPIYSVHLNECHNLLVDLNEDELFGSGLSDDVKLPQSIELTLPRDLKEKEKLLELLNRIWNRCWGFEGRVTEKFYRVKLFVEN